MPASLLEVLRTIPDPDHRRDDGKRFDLPTVARHSLCRGRFPHSQEPDIVARLRSFTYNLIRASGCDNIQNARWRAALDINLVLEIPVLG
jgi:hypothetical protein